MSIVDIVIIALVAMFIVFGIWKGVQRASLGLGAFLIAFVIAFFLAKVVAEALLGIEGIRKFVLGSDGWSLYTWIRKGIGSSVPSEYVITHYYEPITEIIKGFTGYTATFTPNDGLALYCAFLMFSAIVGVGLFLVARLLLCIATMIIKSYIPRRKSGVNRVFGGLVGAVRGFVWALVLTVVFSTMGGLSFVGGFNKIEKEYEDSVIAQKVNDWGYGIRNKMYLPNADMFARLVDKSGLTIDEEEEPPVDVLHGDKLDIYNYLLNLNYISGAPYGYDSETGEATFDETGCEKINPDAYVGTGLDEVFRAIMAYNEQAATSIGSGSLDEMDSGTLIRYKSVLWESNNSIYSILVQDSLLTNAQNYVIKIDELRRTVTESSLAEDNRKLGVMYDEIKSELNALKSLYGDLEPAFGALEFDIPEVVTLTLDKPSEE